MRKIPLKRIAASVVTAAAATAAAIFFSIYTDYIELHELGGGFTHMFWQNLKVSTVTGAISFALFFVLIFLNLMLTGKNLMRMDEAFLRLKRRTPFALVSAALALVAAFLFRGGIASSFLPFLTGERFSLADPIFGSDVGYYVFQRPFYVAVTEGMAAFCVFLMMLTAASYFILYARHDFYGMKRLANEKGVVVHLLGTVIFYLLIRAAAYRFRAEEVLFSANGSFAGGSYVDVNVMVPFYKALPVLIFIIAGLTAVFAMRMKRLLALVSLALYPAAMLAITLTAQIAHTMVVEPNELVLEQTYLQCSMDFTRAAYGLADVKVYDFEVRNDLTAKDITQNFDTIDNIRLIDYGQVVKSANQIQSSRNYYRFVNADIVPYQIDGRLTAVALSAREITTAGMDITAKNYINSKMKYTHGAGVVMSSVNNVTDQGQPYFIIRDLPARALDGAPAITQPRIYFGEQMEDYVLVNTSGMEIDDIDSGSYDYSGSAGIRMTPFNRLVYAVKMGDFKLLASDQLTPQSRMLTNRNVLSRVQMAAPFLNFDEDVYIIIDDAGRLKWIADGYTTSEWFPYSQYSGGINYIRNSVKAVVDAYDGSVKLYITDDGDPIIKSYERIYPTLFEPARLPADLARHLRYPQKVFKIQSEIMKQYHTASVSELYEKRKVLVDSKEKYDSEKTVSVSPYYTVIKLNDSDKPEFVLMQPYTRSGGGMAGWFAMLCSPDNYGKPVYYNLENSEAIPGPYDIDVRIDNDTVISQEIAAWKRDNYTVTRGNMMLVPIRNSILYVKPIYVSSDTEYGKLPEVRRVVVAYGDKIVSKSTLDEALKSLFGVSRPTVTMTNEETLAQVAGRAIVGFEAAQQYAGENDWESYGKAMDALGLDMKALKEKLDEQARVEEEAQEIEE